MSFLNVNRLTYQYGRKTVLSGITFSVEQGSFTGVVGPNGSGKTTLLKLLQRIYIPAGGNIEFCEKDLRSYSSRDLATRIASVTQRPVFAFPFFAEQLVLLGRTPYLNFL
ncbi:ABC transporter ATP-binding protein, partial [bacterium]|nr:ABC transporter ATP-binding protein [bacterium]